MASSEDVLEGFLCPICMTDLKTPHQLTKHFEEFHNDDPEILKSLKGSFFILSAILSLTYLIICLSTSIFNTPLYQFCY